MILRLVLMLYLVMYGLMSFATGQSLDRRHASIINPLDYGATCTSGTLNAAIAGAPGAGSQRILLLTPVDRDRTACTWAITTDVTVPRTITLEVPQGAKATISSGIFLTLNGPLDAKDSAWWSGAGTLTVNYPHSLVSSSFVRSGCAPAVPASSRVLAAFPCTGFVAEGGGVWPIYQAAVGLTIANVNGIHWLAVHRDTTTTVASWTREAGTHYLQRQLATTPATPTGMLLIAKITVAASIITVIEPLAPKFPVELDLARRRVFLNPADSNYIPDLGLFGGHHRINVASGSVITVDTPIGGQIGQDLVIEIVNTTGVLLTVNWSAQFVNTKKTHIVTGRRIAATFRLDDANFWIPTGMHTGGQWTYFGTNAAPGIGSIGAQTSTTFLTNVYGSVGGCIAHAAPRLNIGAQFVVGQSWVNSTDVISTQVFNISGGAATPAASAYDVMVYCP